MRKIMELACDYAEEYVDYLLCGKDPDASYQALQAAVTEMEAENARLVRELAGANQSYVELCRVSTKERDELRTKLQAAEAKLAALAGQEPVARLDADTGMLTGLGKPILADAKLYRSAGAKEQA